MRRRKKRDWRFVRLVKMESGRDERELPFMNVDEMNDECG